MASKNDVFILLDVSALNSKYNFLAQEVHPDFPNNLPNKLYKIGHCLYYTRRVQN